MTVIDCHSMSQSIKSRTRPRHSKSLPPLRFEQSVQEHQIQCCNFTSSQSVLLEFIKHFLCAQCAAKHLAWWNGGHQLRFSQGLCFPARARAVLAVQEATFYFATVQCTAMYSQTDWQWQVADHTCERRKFRTKLKKYEFHTAHMNN